MRINTTQVKCRLLISSIFWKSCKLCYLNYSQPHQKNFSKVCIKIECKWKCIDARNLVLYLYVNKQLRLPLRSSFGEFWSYFVTHISRKNCTSVFKRRVECLVIWTSQLFNVQRTRVIHLIPYDHFVRFLINRFQIYFTKH